VSVQGSTASTSIKEDGTFTIAAPTRDVVLSVRSIGFKRRDVSVSASQNSVQLGLERDFFQLEAIVVTGQATGIERRNLANAVASVDNSKLVKAPASTFEQALMGKVASAQIQDLGGGPGGGGGVGAVPSAWRAWRRHAPPAADSTGGILSPARPSGRRAAQHQDHATGPRAVYLQPDRGRQVDYRLPGYFLKSEKTSCRG